MAGHTVKGLTCFKDETDLMAFPLSNEMAFRFMHAPSPPNTSHSCFRLLYLESRRFSSRNQSESGHEGKLKLNSIQINGLSA